MGQNILLLAIFVLIVLVGSAICSGIEAALLAVNPLHVNELATRRPNVFGAQRLEKLRHRLGRTLTIVTIANNSFNIFGSLMVGSYASYVFQHGHGIIMPIFSIGFTVLVLILGEILPKALGARLSLKISLSSAPILHFLSIIMRPLLILLEQLLPVITAKNEITTDEAEIRQMTKLGLQTGQIEADEAEMIAKVFQLNDLTAKDLMTPRVEAPTLSGTKTLDKIKDIVIAKNISQWIVLGDEVDKIIGVVSRDKILTALLKGHANLTTADLSEEVEFVPEMVKVDRLLTGFNNDTNSVRVVVDEFGGFVGLIGAQAVLAVLAGWSQKSNT